MSDRKAISENICRVKEKVVGTSCAKTTIFVLIPNFLIYFWRRRLEIGVSDTFYNMTRNVKRCVIDPSHYLLEAPKQIFQGRICLEVLG